MKQLNNSQRYFTNYQIHIEEQLNNIVNLFGEDVMVDIYTEAKKYAEEHPVTLDEALCYVSNKYRKDYKYD